MPFMVTTKLYLSTNMEWVNRITGFVANPFLSEVLRWCVSQEVLDKSNFFISTFSELETFYGKCYSQLLHLYLLETPTDFVCIKVAFIMFHFMYFTILFVIDRVVNDVLVSSRDVNVFIFQKNNRFVMKTTTKNRKRNDRFF